MNVSHQRWIMRAGKRYYLTDQDIEKCVFYAWEASEFERFWWGKYDGRKLACIRRLMAAYGESSFNLAAVNVENKNGSWDIGANQINSCHWFACADDSMWGHYCKKYHLDKNSPWSIMNPRNNFRFAAMLNQRFHDINQDTYHFDDNPNKIAFYTYLLRQMGMVKELAEFKKTEENKLAFNSN